MGKVTEPDATIKVAAETKKLIDRLVQSEERTIKVLVDRAVKLYAKTSR